MIPRAPGAPADTDLLRAACQRGVRDRASVKIRRTHNSREVGSPPYAAVKDSRLYEVARPKPPAFTFVLIFIAMMLLVRSRQLLRSS